MKDLLAPFLNKKKKQRNLGLTFGILSYFLSVLLLVLGCLFFDALGKAFFYGLFFPSSLVLVLLGSFFLALGISSSYGFSFFKGKTKQKEIKGEVVSLKPYSVDKHFDSLKISLSDDSFLYWASLFGECPLKEGGTYIFHCSGAWILGWEEK